MTKAQFFELLDYHFRNVNRRVYQEIRQEYEDHFAIGLQNGQTEEEISRALGSPKEIYEQSVEEGLIQPAGDSLLSDIEEICSTFINKVGKTSDNLRFNFSKTPDHGLLGDYEEIEEKISDKILRGEVHLISTDVTLRYAQQDFISLVYRTRDKSMPLSIKKQGQTLVIGEAYLKGLTVKNPIVDLIITMPETCDAYWDIGTTSGDIFAETENNDFNIKTTSGDVHVKTQGRRITVNAVSGDVAIDNFNGVVRAKTVSGDIRLMAEAAEFNFMTVSGDVCINGHQALFGEAATVSGDVNVQLPSDGVSADIFTMTGHIFLPDGSFGKKDGIGRSANYRHGDGKNRLKIKTVSGDVSVKN